MAESNKVTHADMRSFVKYINFLSQNIIHYEGDYRLNLQLDNYNPFARNDQPARAKLADINHAMGITVIHSSSKRTPANKMVDSTAEEIFFLHVRGVPDWIEAQLRDVEQERLPVVLHQVMTDHVMNAAHRSAALENLKPYLSQEKLETGIDEAQETFIWLKDRFNTVVEVLDALVAVHEVIGAWADETNRIGLLCEKPLNRTAFEEELKKIGDIFNQYSDRFNTFQAYSLEIRNKLYTPEAGDYLCHDPAIWLRRLEKGGHEAKPGPVILFDPQEMDRDQFLTEMERYLYERMKRWAKFLPSKGDSAGSPASGSGRAQSTPSHPGAGVHFPDDEQLTTVGHIDRDDLEDIDIPETTNSQTDTTVVTQNVTTALQTGRTVVAYSGQTHGGEMFDSRTRTADLAAGLNLSTHNASRRIAALGQGDGWQQVLGAPLGAPAVAGVYRNPPAAIMAPQTGTSMQPAASPFDFQSAMLDRSPAPPVSSATSPTVQCPGGINTGGRQQRPRQVNNPVNNQGLGAQGMAGGLGPQMHAQNQAQYNQYQVQYNQYMNQSLRQQQQQHQQLIDMTIEDLNNTLRSLKNERDHILARGNPDRMDDFLKGSLRTFHEDLVQARRGRYLSHEMVDYFQAEYCSLADVVQDEKRSQRKKDDLQKNQKSLASINKINLPLLRDTLDGGPWIEQVDFIMKALTEQEQESPIIKQKVLNLIKESLKTATGSLKALKKTIDGYTELPDVVRKIKEAMNNQFVVFDDLQQRVKMMKIPKSRSTMLSNCHELVVLIEYLVSKKLIQHVDQDCFDLIAEKALNPQEHKAKFDLYMAEIFRRDDERGIAYPSHLTELERLIHSMKHYKEMETGRSTRNIAEVSLNKISVLYGYIKSFTNCADLDIKKSEDRKEKEEKKEKGLKPNALYGRGGDSDDESGNSETDDEDDMEMSTFYGKATKKNEENDFCQEYLRFDMDFIKSVNEDPKNKDKQRTCRCGLGPPHTSHLGSLRFCKYFIGVPKFQERKQLLKVRSVCTRCLKMSHTTNLCTSKPLNCFYCSNSNKNAKHSSAMCLGHNDTSFKAFAASLEKARKDKEKKKKEEAREVTNLAVNQEQDESESDGEYDEMEQWSNAIQSHYVGPSKDELEEEIDRAIAAGMEIDKSSVFNYKTNTDSEVLQAVGVTWVSTEGNEEQSLSDEGSQGSFISHKMARRNGCKKLKITNLTVKTMAGEKKERTFIYKVKVYNFKKKKWQNIEVAGVRAIGRTRVMTEGMKKTLLGILKPYNMNLQDIASPKYAEIELLIGNDHAALQLQRHDALNGLSRPENLLFKESAIMAKPVAVGRIYGKQSWTEEDLHESMKKKEMKIPDKKPEKIWEGYKNLRSAEEIRKEKKEITWDSDEEEVTEREENDVYMASITEEKGKEISEEKVLKYMATVDEINIEQDITCCFTDQDDDKRDSVMEKGTMDEYKREKGEVGCVTELADNQECTVMKTEITSDLNENEDDDETFYDAMDEIKGDRTHEVEMDQIEADNKAARLPAIKDSAILESYINNEGILPEVAAKCKDCLEKGCKGCLKAQRANPKEEAVLNEMRESLTLNQLNDGSYQFSCSYVTNENLHNIFSSEKSNFKYAVSQAYRNYKNILAEEGGREAINEMMRRGEHEGHFKFLTEEEASIILGQSHYFCSSTVSWKDSAKRKVRHVSNPSAINKLAGRSLNMLQKAPANTSNNPLWPLQNFFLYKYAYSADISSAYRRVKIKENHQPFQLVIFFDFTKEDWHLFPIVTLQTGMIFGATQSGTYLDLAIEVVADEAITLMVEITLKYLRQVDNMLNSFRTKQELEFLGEEIYKLMRKYNLPLQFKFSSIERAHPDWEADTPVETLLGYQWDKRTDQILPNINLTRDNKTKKFKGDLIKDKPFRLEEMTKRRLLSLLSSLYDPLGTFLSPLRLTMKALYSSICIELPGKTREAFDTPLTNISTDLARVTVDICNSLAKLEDLQPLERNIIPEGYEVNHIIVTKDGSSTGFSSTIHLTSKHKTEAKYSCKITRAISRVKIAAAATTELMGYPLAMGLLGSFLEATYFAWSDYKEEYGVYVMGDAKSSLFSLGSHPKSIIARSTRNKVLEQARNLTTKYPKVKINFGYLPSQDLPADLNSKIHSNLMDKMNSSLWRTGPEVFLKEKVLMQQVYIKYNKETRNLEIIQQMPKNIPVEKDEGPKDGKQIIETIQKQVFSLDNVTSTDGVVEEEDDWEKQDSPEEDWLDREERMTQLTTMSQSMLLAHNFGVCDIVQADGVKCYIPISGELEFDINTNMYKDMLEKTNSIGHLIAKVTHVVVTPKMLIKKIRERKEKKEITENTLSSKIICAWTWILLHSQALFPPQGLRKEYAVESRCKILHVETNIDSRPNRPASVPLLGKDTKLLELLVWKAHYMFTGIKGKVLHRSIGGTAAMLRAGNLGVFTASYKRSVTQVLENCFTCIKRSDKTIYASMKSYHRVSVQQPFERLSLDILGPFTVKASSQSRARIKLHALSAVCLSTGLITQILMEKADYVTVVRSLWMLQMRYNVQITHLQSDAVTAFNNLGAVVRTEANHGEHLRLFIMLETIKRSGAKGQHSNIVEASVKRLKKLWDTTDKFIKGLEGYSMQELEFMLETLCSTLNNQPLDPDYSNICPGDFLSGYRQIPINFEYHNPGATRKSFERIREGFNELRKVYNGSRMLSRYVGKTKGLGRVKKDLKKGDVLFIRSLKRLGIARDVSTTQVKVKYINAKKIACTAWHPKTDLIFLLVGSIYDNRKPPSNPPTVEVEPDKGKPE